MLSQTQQQYESRVIPFKRGDILDRNGTILATSEKVYNLILDCKVVNDTSQNEAGDDTRYYMEPTINALVEVLGVDEEEIRSRLDSEETAGSQYQILKTDVTVTEMKAFEAYLDLDSDENENLSDAERSERSKVKGVWFEETYQRVYPMNSLACDLIGFTYDGTTADWGIEGYYSSALNGVNGRQYGYFNTDADVEQTIIEPQDGKNVVSTIDVNIQQIIRSAIESFEASYANGPNGADAAENIGVIVMDPNTGEILGMDSSDWYDLNHPRDLTAFYSEEEIAAMDTQTMTDNLNSIWRNYCISDAYEPGSTVKPLTIAAALEANRISESDTYECDGYQEIAGQLIRCSIYPGAHGTLTLDDVLSQSCNDALMQIGAKLGTEDYLRYMDIFNLGYKTGIDLPGENAGLLYTAEDMGEVELATNSFGQGYTLTMVQEAAAFSSLINGGYYYKPHVVSEITDSTGAVVQTISSVVERQTVSAETSDVIRETLGSVVSPTGTGASMQIAGYSMGGKTGTAQKLPREDNTYLVSYIGFAPLDDPQVVVYVVVDEPNVADQSHSTYAQEIARNIMTELLPYLSIFPDHEATELELASISIYHPSEVSGTENTEETEAAAQDEQGVSDPNVADPPEESTEEMQEDGNDMLSDGISNEDQELISE